MIPLIRRLINSKHPFRERIGNYDRVNRQVNALYGMLSQIYGTDKLILKATKLEALELMRSNKLPERVLGLQKIVQKDPTLEKVPRYSQLSQIVFQIEEEIADLVARQSVKKDLEEKVKERLKQRYVEYMKDIKAQVIKEHLGNENAQTLKRLAVLEKMNQVNLTGSIVELLRPSSLEEIVGQEQAVKALVAKLATPFPQHILLYGPPGVGKTTSARLALKTIKQISGTIFAKDAPFVEVNGSILRWDPREATNPLLGSVHDPIYQGAKKELAEGGIPEPKLGLVSEAHGGILFIDEIGELDPVLQNKLLKVMEDKRVIFESSYFDPDNSSVPQYIRKLFQEGAPADFILIGATTRNPGEINPAIRSRCSEIYFEPLTPQHIQKIVENAANKLYVKLEPGASELISEYTIEGRKATNLVADAYGLALYEKKNLQNYIYFSTDRKIYNKEAATQVAETMETNSLEILKKRHFYEVIQTSRLTPYVTCRASSTIEEGRILGLGITNYLGTVLEIEAIAFPSKEKGKGTIRFNETAGSMAKDSVFNATSLLRSITGEEISNYDLHINVVGGGKIDGPSAGLAVVLVILSAVKGWGIYQDIAVTGEISIQGKVKPVGGVFEKIYGARQAKVKTVLIPKENIQDIPTGITGIKIIPVNSVEEAIPLVIDQEDIRSGTNCKTKN